MTSPEVDKRDLEQLKNNKYVHESRYLGQSSSRGVQKEVEGEKEEGGGSEYAERVSRVEGK